MPSQHLTPNEQLKLLRNRLGLNQVEMAERLGITREWLSKLETGDRAVSELVQLKLDALAKENSRHAAARLNSGVLPATASEKNAVLGGEVASRLPPESRSPSTRSDVQAYIQQLLEAAESSGNPNAWPVIHDRLKKRFPLDEWEGAPE